jgi:DNA-directed RNA polymerase subunit RPC12/RpoP
MPRPALHPLTSDFLNLDINTLRRDGVLSMGRSGSITWSTGSSVIYKREAAGLRLTYQHGRDADRHVDDLIPIVYSRTNFDGHRAWFQCRACGRQVGKLYGGRLFRCRRCRSAVYASQRENAISRATSQRWKLRQRLEERGCKDALRFGLDDGFPEKPPRMHWRTYRRLEAQDERLGAVWTAVMGSWMLSRDRCLARRRSR